VMQLLQIQSLEEIPDDFGPINQTSKE
jgi:hypothetical protein